MNYEKTRLGAACLVLSAMLALNGCVPPTLAIYAFVVIGAYTSKTLIYQSVEAVVDEVIRPWLKGGRSRVAVDPSDPLRGRLSGRFEFTREKPLPPETRTFGQIDVVRDSIDSPWRYDPLFIRTVKQQLSADELQVRQQ